MAVRCGGKSHGEEDKANMGPTRVDACRQEEAGDARRSIPRMKRIIFPNPIQSPLRSRRRRISVPIEAKPPSSRFQGTGSLLLFVFCGRLQLYRRSIIDCLVVPIRSAGGGIIFVDRKSLLIRLWISRLPSFDARLTVDSAIHLGVAAASYSYYYREFLIYVALRFRLNCGYAWSLLLGLVVACRIRSCALVLL